MLSAAIGLELRTARKARGVSRASLASQAGVSVRLVAELERGERPNVSLETALQLLRALGMTLLPAAAETIGDPDGARRERDERSAVRRATWVGAIASLSDERAPVPPDTIRGRIAAVTHASNLAHAIALGAKNSAVSPNNEDRSALESVPKSAKTKTQRPSRAR
jgi:transcriptional regulator with XRE-family HTH domain